MIIVRVYGGLGNQMFQYAFYKALLKQNENVYLDISDYDIHNHHNGFELEKIFDIKFNNASKSQIKKVSIDKKKYIYRIIKKIFNIDIVKSSEYIEMNNISNVRLQRMPDNIYFNGFWQDKVYIEYIYNEILEEFKFKQVLDGKNKDLLTKLEGYETVSVHIRRGDYLNNKSLGEICDKDYYKRAIQFIESKIDNPVFVFFSDDMNWVKDNFKLGYKCIYVDWNKKENSYKDMQLMSLCKHNIIANSTFSWWAAFLNKNKNKIVIGPQKWCNEFENNNLLLDGWIKK